jgi:hypothetical protein
MQELGTAYDMHNLKRPSSIEPGFCCIPNPSGDRNLPLLCRLGVCPWLLLLRHALVWSTPSSHSLLVSHVLLILPTLFSFILLSRLLSTAASLLICFHISLLAYHLHATISSATLSHCCFYQGPVVMIDHRFPRLNENDTREVRDIL